MANYKQDKVVGWQRSRQVTIKNDYKAIPTIEFAEEFIVEMDGQLINKKEMGAVTSTLKDPSVSLDLLNPITDEKIGTVSYGEVYAVLYSVYRYLADKRDFRDTKVAALDGAKAALKDAQLAVGSAMSEFNKAKAAFDKDTKNAALGQALASAQTKLDAATAQEAAAKVAVENATAELEAASDYL